MDIKELAIAYWRLDKWVSIAPVEKKMAATSSLRNIKKYLDENDIEVLDPTGQKYDVGMAVDVIRNNLTDDDGSALISETTKPIIMQNGSVIMCGQVIVDKEVKPTPVLKPILPPEIEDMLNQNKTEENKIEDNAEPVPDEHVDARKKNPMFPIVATLTLCIAICILIMQFKIYNKPSDNATINNTAQTNDNTSSVSEEFETVNKKLDEISETVTSNTSDDELKFVKYVVKEGDSLWSICMENNLDYASVKNMLIGLNYISDENSIFVGQTLYIPKN